MNVFRHKRSINKKPVPFFLNQHLFPELIKKNDIKKNDIKKNDIDETINYSNAIKSKQLTNKEDDLITPGWIKIQFNKKKRLIEYTSSIHSSAEKVEDEEEEHPNIIMDRIITQIKLNRLNHKSNFEELNGEGSFQEYYKVSDVYDYNSDNEDGINDFDLNDRFNNDDEEEIW